MPNRSCLELRARHRFARAWLVTGPAGHLVAGMVDWLGLLGGYALRRASENASRHRRS